MLPSVKTLGENYPQRCFDLPKVEKINCDNSMTTL
jgi:hypothetical protein